MKKGLFPKGITKKNSYLLFLGMLSMVVGGLFSVVVTGGNDQRATHAEIFPGLQTLRKGDNVDEYVKKQLIFCKQFPENSKDKFDCSKSMGEYLTSKLDFKTLVSSLESSGLDCHDEMHYVVNSEYKKGTTMQEIWGQCSDACFGACYHGGLEGILQSRQLSGKDTESIHQVLEQECESVQKTYPVLSYQCYHGVGHAFMLLSDGELFDSLRLCDKLKSFTRNCYEGVFMENIPTSRTAHHSKSYINPDDKLYPCNAVDKKYQGACYSFQVSYITQSSEIDNEKPYEICLDFPEEFRAECYSQIVMPYFDTASIDQPKIRDKCNTFPEGWPRGACIRGGIMGFIDRFPGNTEKLSSVYNYCSAVDSSYKNDCFSEAFKTVQQVTLDKETRDTYCNKISEDKYRQECLSNEYL